MTIDSELLEALSELEHEQWRVWRSDVERRFGLPHSESLDKGYSELSEAEKEEDRVFARRVLALLEKRRLI